MTRKKTLHNEKPTVAVTMGDPSGIGPEIVVKALDEGSIFDVCNVIVAGDREFLEKVAIKCGIENFSQRFGDYIYGVSAKDFTEDMIGKISAESGKIAYESIKYAHLLCTEGKASAVATAPINKESLKAAKIDFIGHTEIFAALTDTEDPLTMFETKGLRVFFLTRHLSLMNAIKAIDQERIIDYIKRCSKALEELYIYKGRISVAALNPHSGEHGLFGTEEEEIIRPAVNKAKQLGYDVEGPVSADSVFYLALTGRYDAVISLYHDQGHIATKTLDFQRTVSFTLGMPYLRTSVDHGTAFDIAGKGEASAVSMIEAIRLAAKYL